MSAMNDDAHEQEPVSPTDHLIKHLPMIRADTNDAYFTPKRGNSTPAPEEIEYSAICNVCQAMFDDIEEFEGTPNKYHLGMYTIEQTVKSLEASFDSCHLCFLIWTELSTQEREILLEKCTEISHMLSIPQSEVSVGWLRIDFKCKADPANTLQPLSPDWKHTKNGEVFRSVTFDIYPTASIPRISKTVPNFKSIKLSISTNSEVTLETIQKWIGNCVADHPNCLKVSKQSRKKGYLPTRLIHIGLEGEPLHPRLCNRTELSETVRYVTLSHCWGGKQPLRLLQSNRESFFTEIPLGDDSILFRDVMLIARRLDVQYIWIDSLCIQQDSADDWATEAASMHNVYSRAFLNIASVRSQNCLETCFDSHSKFSAQPCRVKDSNRPQLSFDCIPALWDRDILSSAYMTRAWILQERYLATRILYYAKNQVFWDCCTLRACETYPDGLPAQKTNGKGRQQSLGPAASAIKKNLFSLKDQEFNRSLLWKEIVEEYSTCFLTQAEKDKFIALTGVAATLGRGQDYVAGHWKPDLINEMLWETKENGAVRRSFTRAPSWSWASLDGEITFAKLNEGPFTSLARLISIHAQLKDERNPFGAIEPGSHVVLSAPLFKTRFIKTKSTTPSDDHDWTTDGMDLEPKCDIGEFTSGEEHIWTLFFKRDSAFEPSAWGIVLTPTGAKGEYTRSGYLHVKDRSTPWGKLMKLAGQDVDPDLYIEKMEIADLSVQYAHQNVPPGKTQHWLAVKSPVQLPMYKIKIF